MFQMLKTGFKKAKELVCQVAGAVQVAAVTGAVALSSLFTAKPASAAVDAAITAGISSLESDATDLGAAVMGGVVAIMLIVLGIRLAKRLFSKAV
jgi:hypothetical protein